MPLSIFEWDLVLGLLRILGTAGAQVSSGVELEDSDIV